MSLDAAQRAFDAGNFYEARRRAEALLAETDDPALRAGAAELLQRTGVDPAIVWITVGCVVLFVVIVASAL